MHNQGLVGRRDNSRCSTEYRRMVSVTNRNVRRRTQSPGYWTRRCDIQVAATKLGLVLPRFPVVIDDCVVCWSELFLAETGTRCTQPAQRESTNVMNTFKTVANVSVTLLLALIPAGSCASAIMCCGQKCLRVQWRREIKRPRTPNGTRLSNDPCASKSRHFRLWFADEKPHLSGNRWGSHERIVLSVVKVRNKINPR